MTELHEDADDTFFLMSIDPGTSTLGFCLYKIHVETLEIVDIFAWTVDATRLAYYRDDVAEIHGEKFARIIAHKKNLANVLSFYAPLIVVCETPFFNRLRPSAGGPLFELYATIEQTVFEWDHCKPLYGVDPRTVKKNVKAQGNKKPDMIAAMVKIPELQCANLDLLDEHAIDAVAVGYTKILELRAKKERHEANRKRKELGAAGDHGTDTGAPGLLAVCPQTGAAQATGTGPERGGKRRAKVKREPRHRNTIRKRFRRTKRSRRGKG